jgi:glucokinase
MNDFGSSLTGGRLTTYLFTGDIGGTNSRMALYDTDSTVCSVDSPLVVKYYRNATSYPEDAYSDPEAFATYIVAPFLQHCWEESGAPLKPLAECRIIACMAAAGAVINNRVKMTNLNDMLIDGNLIQDNRHHPYLKRIAICRVINDFVAQGYGCLTLKNHEVRQLAGPKVLNMEDLTDGPKACVGAGTGLGECYLTKDTHARNYVCFPSEGGHVEYAPRNDLEVQLWRFLNEKFSSKDRVSVERVVSGKGLANVYEFLAHNFPERIVQDIHEDFLKAADEQGKVIAMNAVEGTLCDQALSLMMGAYGCEVGSAAIKFIPTGGLFVTGGLTPKNINRIDNHNSEFMLAYRNKGRVSIILDRIPLFAVLVEDLGVRGAHKLALMQYQEFTQKAETVQKAKSSLLGRLIQEYAWTATAITAIAGFTAGVLYNERTRRVHRHY